MGVPEGNRATPLITQRSQVQILPPLLPQKGPNSDRFGAFCRFDVKYPVGCNQMCNQAGVTRHGPEPLRNRTAPPRMSPPLAGLDRRRGVCRWPA